MKNVLKTACCGIIAVTVAGCASGPADYQYVGAATAARAPVDQVLSQCKAESNTSPALTNAAANPLFAASMQAQFVNDCMAAKGYRSAP